MSDDPRAEEIKAAARDLAEEAIAALREVMNNTEEKGAARVAAGKAILERGFGAPDRRIEKTVDVNLHDHRTAHLRALETLASRQSALPPPREHIADAEFEEIARDERS